MMHIYTPLPEEHVCRQNESEVCIKEWTQLRTYIDFCQKRGKDLFIDETGLDLPYGRTPDARAASYVKTAMKMAHDSGATLVGLWNFEVGIGGFMCHPWSIGYKDAWKEVRSLAQRQCISVVPDTALPTLGKPVVLHERDSFDSKLAMQAVNTASGRLVRDAMAKEWQLSIAFQDKHFGQAGMEAFPYPPLDWTRDIADLQEKLRQLPKSYTDRHCIALVCDVKLSEESAAAVRFQIALRSGDKHEWTALSEPSTLANIAIPSHKDGWASVYARLNIDGGNGWIARFGLTAQWSCVNMVQINVWHPSNMVSAKGMCLFRRFRLAIVDTSGISQ